MSFLKNNAKNIVIGLLAILLIIAGIVIFKLYNTEPERIIEVTGKVIVADDAYIIVEADKDYVLSSVKGTYNVGDEMKFTYSENAVNSGSDPITITSLIDEEIVKVNTTNEDNYKNEDTNTIENSEDNSLKDSSSNNTNNSSNKSYNSNNNSSNNSTATNEKEEVIPNGTNENITNNITNSTNNASSADATVIKYLEDLEAEVSASNVKNSVKNGFITVVDFLFYNGEIKGYTFEELSSSAKLKVLSLALSIDSKIEEHFPNYKESISNTTGRVYTNIKEKVVAAYLDITTSICSSNAELCITAKENFSELKTSFGFTWDMIKDLAGSGITKLKSWYEIWSGK